MLKQQLQKTEEEFSKQYQDIVKLTGEGWSYGDGHKDMTKEIKNFIRQAQIKAVKAFAEESKIQDKKFPRGERLWCKECCVRLKKEQQRIANNLLKDI